MSAHPLDPISDARNLGPRIRALADQIEAGRRLPQELGDDLVRAGLMHLALPNDYGGSETDPITAARVLGRGLGARLG
jgi:alkylation response protein AidB-like acyl-CoA dehydrogenase